MALWGKKARRGEELIKSIQAAVDRAPLAEMEELIALARAQANVKRAVVKVMEAIASDGTGDLVSCWFILVAGELGREGLLPVLWSVGRSEGDAADEAAIPVLTRHILEVFPDVLREIHLSEDIDRGYGLYEALEGALVLGDEGVRERLRTFALERWEVERESPDPELVHEPLCLLCHLGDSKLVERMQQARRLCQRGDLLDCNLNDVESMLRGEEHFLEPTRQTIRNDWKATARNIEKLFTKPGEA